MTFEIEPADKKFESHHRLNLQYTSTRINVFNDYGSTVRFKNITQQKIGVFQLDG